MTLRVHPDEIVRTSTSQLLSKHESWERVRLGEIAEVLNGFAFKSSHFDRDKGVPLLRIRDVGSSSTQTRYEGDYDARFLVGPGAIVVGMDGDFRAARWRGPPALLNQRVCAISLLNPDLYDEAFLLYALPGYLDAIHDWTSSTTVKHLSSETIKAIPLPLPPLAEQRRIVAAIEEHLSRLDAAMETLLAARQRLGVLTATVIAAAAEAEPSVKLGDLAIQARYGSSTKCSYEAHGPPVIRIPNVRDRHVDTGDLKRAVDLRAEVGRLEVDDLLFVRTNGSRDLIGRVGVVDEDAAGMGFASYLIRVRLDTSRVDSGYVALALSTRRARAEIERRAASTAGQYNLSRGAIAELTIPLPSLERQRKLRREVEVRLSSVDRLRKDVDRARTRAEALRRAVLARAFRGELVRQDSNDEPASVLLERIAAERPVAPRAAQKRKERMPT